MELVQELSNEQSLALKEAADTFKWMMSTPEYANVQEIATAKGSVTPLERLATNIKALFPGKTVGGITEMILDLEKNSNNGGQLVPGNNEEHSEVAREAECLDVVGDLKIKPGDIVIHKATPSAKSNLYIITGDVLTLESQVKKKYSLPVGIDSRTGNKVELKTWAIEGVSYEEIVPANEENSILYKSFEAMINKGIINDEIKLQDGTVFQFQISFNSNHEFVVYPRNSKSKMTESNKAKYKEAFSIVADKYKKYYTQFPAHLLDTEF